MCVKLPLGDLNHDLYFSYPTSTYICRVTIAPRIYGDINLFLRKGSVHIIMIDYSNQRSTPY